MNPTDHLPFPSKLEELARLLALSHSISLENAKLILLRTVGTAVQNAYTVYSPEGIDLAPNFHVAFAVPGSSLLRGAVKLLLDCLARYCGEAYEPVRGFGPEHNQIVLEEMLAKRKILFRELAGRRATADALQKQAEAIRNHYAEMERLEAELTPENEARLKAMRADGSLLRDSRDIHSRLSTAQTTAEGASETLAECDAQLATFRLRFGPSLIRDECAWRELREACNHSFDGGIVNILSAPQALAELSTMSKRELCVCAGLLHHATINTCTRVPETDRSAKPGIVLVQNPRDLVETVLQPRMRAAHVFDEFLFVSDLSAEFAPERNARETMLKNTSWPKFIIPLFEMRSRDERHRVVLDSDGIELYCEFKNWCAEFEESAPESIACFPAHWPHTALRIALCLQALEGNFDASVLRKDLLHSACAFLKNNAAQQTALFQIKPRDAVSPEERRRKLDALEMRLRVRGPLSLRDLVRSYSNQDYDRVSGLLNELIIRKRVERRGTLFFATQGHVSAALDEICAGGEGGVKG